ncbi:MAG: ribosome-binding factor A [Acidimicrobiales bacterium]
MRRQPARHYPRTARLNELVREIVAEEIERIDDDRLDLVTVIRVIVEPDMRHAIVHYDSLGGPDDDADVTAALADHRVRLQAAIARQARTKRVPELAFRPDEVERSAARVEEILRRLRRDESSSGEVDG